jgi:hypothetical protein
MESPVENDLLQREIEKECRSTVISDKLDDIPNNSVCRNRAYCAALTQDDLREFTTLFSHPRKPPGCSESHYSHYPLDEKCIREAYALFAGKDLNWSAYNPRVPFTRFIHSCLPSGWQIHDATDAMLALDTIQNHPERVTLDSKYAMILLAGYALLFQFGWHDSVARRAFRLNHAYMDSGIVSLHTDKSGNFDQFRESDNARLGRTDCTRTGLPWFGTVIGYGGYARFITYANIYMENKFYSLKDEELTKKVDLRYAEAPFIWLSRDEHYVVSFIPK